MKPRVLVIGGADHLIARMFLANNWEVVLNELYTNVDLVQFTGGEDVDPSYYKEQRHPSTRSNPNRDAREAGLYQEMLGLAIPMAGICRGAQFLNVMNGGKMWQHVTNHAIGSTHEALDLLSGEEVDVTSTHHQMMIPHKNGQILMTANVAKYKQGFEKEEAGGKKPDIEAVFYPDTKSLCYQPHPEYTSPNHPCQLTYFNYIKTFFNL